MSNGFFFTPAELACFTADCTLDDNGNIVYGSAAADVVQTAIKRAQRKSTRKPRKTINDKNIAEIRAKMLEILQVEPDIAETVLSERLWFDRITLCKNEVLNDHYESFQRMNSNSTPSTVNNDPDSYFDNDD